MKQHVHEIVANSNSHRQLAGKAQQDSRKFRSGDEQVAIPTTEILDNRSALVNGQAWEDAEELTHVKRFVVATFRQVQTAATRDAFASRISLTACANTSIPIHRRDEQPLSSARRPIRVAPSTARARLVALVGNARSRSPRH